MMLSKSPAYLTPPVNGCCWINELPDELLVQIFSHCLLGDLGRSQLVSKRWNSVSKEDFRWKFNTKLIAEKPERITLPRKISYFEGMFIIDELAHLEPKILTVYGPSHGGEFRMGLVFPFSLTHIRFKRFRITSELLASLPETLTWVSSPRTRLKGRLQRVYLDQCCGLTADALKQLPKGLKSLELRNSSLAEPEALAGLQFFPHAESRSLCITGSRNLSAANFKALPPSWGHITLYKRDDLSSETLNSLPEMGRLVLRTCDLSSAQLEGLPSHLQILDLVKCKRIEQALSLVPTTLHIVWIKDSDDFSEQSLRGLSQGLNVIRLSGCPNISNDTLTVYQAGARGRIQQQLISDSCSHLRIQNCPELTREDLALLPDSLKTLQIWNCPRITEEDLSVLPSGIKASLLK